MTADQVKRAQDPFFTTRTTRIVGLGLPFFKQAAESTGGTFSINSEKGIGTIVKAVFILSHIDRMPLGDISSTIHTLVVFNEQIDEYDDKSFTLDTREMREMLGDEISFMEPEVSLFIWEYLDQNKHETDGGADI